MTKEIIKVKDFEVSVIRKEIKNFHLSVLPPDGKIRVAVPLEINDEIVKLFIIKKYHWIKKHIDEFAKQERQTEREYVSGESHYFKGKRYVLKVNYASRPSIEIKNKKNICFNVPARYSKEQKRNYFENWLRKELKKELDVLIPKWENLLKVKAREVKIKKMRTKWGSCNPDQKRVWINLELIKKPSEYLEYIVVHELAHLLERKHNKNFEKILNLHMPKWRSYKKRLNEFVL